MDHQNDDLIDFAIAHITDKNEAKALYEVCFGDGSVDVEDIELPNDLLMTKKRGCIHFAFYVKNEIFCCCAHSVRITPEIVKDAEGFRLAMLTAYIRDRGENIEWPVKIKQVCAPVSDDVGHYEMKVAKGEIEDEELKRMFRLLFATYTCHRIDGDIPEKLRDPKYAKGELVTIKDPRQRPESPELYALRHQLAHPQGLHFFLQHPASHRLSNVSLPPATQMN